MNTDTDVIVCWFSYNISEETKSLHEIILNT